MVGECIKFLAVCFAVDDDQSSVKYLASALHSLLFCFRVPFTHERLSAGDYV